MSSPGALKHAHSESGDEASPAKPAKVKKTDREKHIDLQDELRREMCDDMRDYLKKFRVETKTATQKLSECNWALYVSTQVNEKLARENAVLQEHIGMLEARLSEKED
ncbi:hypothetical protein GL218_04961 [Daldinia childiae]|uniref:uncharacterized protein n=1 Tax=Daldinia childiae TaxID=326645 RepID=UPI00144750D9|nr:uncharacterized protein GL218_04961 [Daldinia childiae]KAF3059945.1 hypothetical protein GL218_04961 [Daldinia childiae]